MSRLSNRKSGAVSFYYFCWAFWGEGDKSIGKIEWRSGNEDDPEQESLARASQVEFFARVSAVRLDIGPCGILATLEKGLDAFKDLSFSRRIQPNVALSEPS